MSVLFFVLFASVVFNVTSQLNHKRTDSAHDLEVYQIDIIRDSERLQNHRFDVQPPSTQTKQYSLSPKRGTESVFEYKNPGFSAFASVTESSKRSKLNYASNEKFNRPESFKPPVKEYAPYRSVKKVPETPIHPSTSTTQANYVLTDTDDENEIFLTSGKGYSNSKALEKSSYSSKSYGYGNYASHHAYHHHVKPFLDFSPLFLALVPICLTIGAAAAFALASVISNNNINNNNNNNNLQQQTQQGQQQQQLALSYPYFILYNTTLQGVSIIGKK